MQKKFSFFLLLLASTGGSHTITTSPGATLNFVDWCDEPKHTLRGEKSYARVYTAQISPGEQTLFHRHSYNTLYITLDDGEGADLQNEVVKAGQGILAPVKAETKSGMPFFMLHRDEEYIHRITSAASNTGTVKFMACEILSAPPSPPPSPSRLAEVPDMCYDLVLSSPAAKVFRLILRPFETTGAHSLDLRGVVFFLSSTKQLRVKLFEAKGRAEAKRRQADFDAAAAAAGKEAADGKEQRRLILERAAGGAMGRMPGGVTIDELNELRATAGAPPVGRGGNVEEMQARMMEAVEGQDEGEQRRTKKAMFEMMLADLERRDRSREETEGPATPPPTLSPFGRGNERGTWEWIEGPVVHEIRNMGGDNFEAILVEIL